VIPKILHFIWTGDDARRPDGLLATWVNNNPSWTIKVWGRSDLHSYPWRNRKHVHEMARRDADGLAALLRWEILLDEGGLLFDIDSSSIQPLDENLLDCEAFACWEDELKEPGRVCARYVGSVPENPFFEKLVSRLGGEESEPGPSSVDDLAGSGFLTRMWRAERYTGLTLYPSCFFNLPDSCATADLKRGQVYSTRRGRRTVPTVDPDRVFERDESQRIAGCPSSDATAGHSSRQLLVDISELIRSDARTGIQRVTRSILRALLQHPPAGYRTIAVYADAARPGYLHAEQFSKAFLSPQTRLFDADGRPMFIEDDHPIEFHAGDLFLGLDLQMRVVPAQAKYLQRMRRFGVKVAFVVYDLLPVQMPQYFPSGFEASFRCWLDTVTRCDGAICISRAVAEELAQWTRENGPERLRELRIDWFHIGADIGNSAPSLGMPTNAPRVLQAIARRPSFLVVGTLEPRKGHAQTLDAFERLWEQGTDIHLVIVGKRGWLVEKLFDRLHGHPESGKRLFWLEAISDEYLEEIYAVATCLIFPSEGEGFGLPLIEAAQHGLPILARDIPVFREVAGEQAAYFSGRSAGDLARAVLHWLKLHDQGRAPTSNGLSYLSWEQSTARLLECLLRSNSRH